MINVIAFILIFTRNLAWADREAPGKVTPELESRIVGLYSSDRCDQVRSMVRADLVPQLRPNIIAIVASCEPSGMDPEQLFTLAEARNPTGDLILTLHARYRYKKNPESSDELWKKVQMTARNPFLREMARAHLERNVEADADKKPLDLSSTTFYGRVQIGGGHETNPRLPIFAGLTSNPSTALYSKLNLSAQHWYSFGSITANYALTANEYFASHAFDFMENSLDLPVAVRVGSNEDVAFRPFFSFLTNGGSSLQSLGGIGVLGVIYRSDYKQSVQGMVFFDRFYPEALTNQQGTHFRFEYSWEFFPKSWYLRLLTYIEHVETNSDIVSGVPATIPYSHTDFGPQFNIHYDFGRFTLGFAPRFLFRVDSDVSNFVATDTGSPTLVRRKDTQIVLQPNVTIPILPYLQIFAWYEWNRVFSNIGQSAYVDRNYLNQSVGVALRTFVSSY